MIDPISIARVLVDENLIAAFAASDETTHDQEGRAVHIDGLSDELPIIPLDTEETDDPRGFFTD